MAGQHDAARITIASGATLTSGLGTTRITGTLEIEGDGSLTNQGILDANTSGVLLLTVNTVDDSSGAGRRRCINGSAVLRFTDPTGKSIGTFGPMEGESVLSAGEIEVNTALTTTGRLDISADTLDVNASLTMGSEGYPLAMTGGTIDVAAGDTFRHY